MRSPTPCKKHGLAIPNWETPEAKEMVKSVYLWECKDCGWITSKYRKVRKYI